ncbi:MAG: ATP-binding protein [Gammaproteobacteria bacterium]
MTSRICYGWWKIARQSLLVFFLPAALLGLAGMYHYFSVSQTKTEALEYGERLNVALGKKAIKQHLAGVVSDLLYLSEHHDLQNLFVTAGIAKTENIANEFLKFSRRKGVYDQIRLLDERGIEIIRVNYNDGQSVIVGASQLQDKSERYYFDAAWKLGREQIYLSPLDLNVEQGRIEQPRKAVLRFGTPIYDSAGNKRAVILLNYLGNKLLEDFRTSISNIADHTVLLNADGFWLSSAKPEQDWGFMFGDNRTFADFQVDAWEQIRYADAGQFYGQNGLFTFSTVGPLSFVNDSQQAFGTNSGNDGRRNFFWKIVSHVPPPDLAHAALLGQQLPLYILILVILIAGSVVLATDITKRKAIEDRLHRHEEDLEELVAERTRELHVAQIEKERVMEQLIQVEKMAAIGTLVSGIGHEINNPLYIVLGMAEAITEEQDSALRREYSEQIIKYSKQIAETVKNLSSYAKPGTKHELQNVDLNEIISAAVLVVNQSLQTEDIEIRLNTEPVPGILAKSEEIQQVLFNIIRNGIQACGERGLLEIESRHVGEWVVVSISDTGAGIPADIEKKMFDPFFTTKGPDEGQGLGLYIVQQIITRYGGSIELDRGCGTGATFIIRFPVAD